MTQDLFREQVIKARSAASAHFGPTKLTVSRVWWWFLTLLCALFAFSLLFAITVDLARVEKSRGQLVFSENVARIVPDRAGLVSRVFVKDGDYVQTGAPLFEVTRHQGLKNGELGSDQALDALLDELQALESRKQASVDTLAVQLEMLSAGITSREASITRQKANIARLDARDEELSDRVSNYQDFLSEGLVTEQALDDEKDAYQQNLDMKASSADALADLEAELVDLTLERKRLRFQTENEIAQIDERLAQLKRLQSQSELEFQYTVKAPISGLITSMEARVGTPALPDKLSLAIVPRISKLQAELHVSSAAMGFLEEGQTVRLLYDAFPFMRYGAATGQIRGISSVAVPSNQFDVAQIEGSVYRIVVELDRQTVVSQDQTISLQSGMEFTAEIELERRRVIDWLAASLAGNS